MSGDFSEMTDSMHDVMSLDGDVAKLRAFYDGWADNYDADVADDNYGMPDNVVRVLLAGLSAQGRGDDRTLTVLDAGCGTGLVGASLVAAGFTDLHGVDLSADMVTHAAERGIYASLQGGVDLSTTAPDHLQRSADVVTVGGVFTVGHVPPTALAPMASMVRSGGVLAVSTRAAYLAETNFREVAEHLVANGSLRLLAHVPDEAYTMDSNGDYWAFEVQ